MEFERVMGVDIPSTFEVLSAKRSIGIDISAQYTIRFREEEFLAIVDKLDLSKWEHFQDNKYLYSLRLMPDERNSYTVDLIMEKNILHLVYLHD
ncbi:MAG: hypothetical protein IT291_00270 [Deltaproteobacteria bacterium]|nr:hypothetical protein [Deltaproteobacteria bacterium]